MKIGIQTYTLRDHLKTPNDINASFKRIKEMGFDMIQLSGLGEIDPDELTVLLNANGLTVVGSHSPWERIKDKNELAKLIDEHIKWNARQIGLGIKPSDYPDTYDGYTNFINDINEACRQITTAGLYFGYHNHELEFMKFNGQRAFDRMIEECPQCEFTLDVFWVQAGGMDPCYYIDKLKNRIRILHLKDFRIMGRDRQFAEIGQGNLDWQKIFSRCTAHGIPYAVIEQDDNFLTDPFESLALSRKFLVDNGFWG
ncbi:MAG: sugar phosphate isomerase/epimerase [Treponema sp.]|nr:sugar phosphate isomerase/epimerase [Treponema sp.]